MGEFEDYLKSYNSYTRSGGRILVEDPARIVGPEIDARGWRMYSCALCKKPLVYIDPKQSKPGMYLKLELAAIYPDEGSEEYEELQRKIPYRRFYEIAYQQVSEHMTMHFLQHMIEEHRIKHMCDTPAISNANAEGWTEIARELNKPI